MKNQSTNIQSYRLDKIDLPSDKLTILSGLKYVLKKDAFLIGPNDIVTPPHVHANELEIILNVSSDISFLIDGNLYPLKRGDVIISKPKEVHVCIYNSRKVQEMFILWINEKDYPELFDSFYGQNFSHKVCFENNDQTKIISLFEKLNDNFLKENKDLEKVSIFLDILSLIKNGNKKEKTVDLIPENFQKILDQINKNFSTIYSIKDVLEQNYISYSTLNRFFNNYLSVSPKQYLESVKLSNAVKMLEQDASVSDACFKSGFNDCSRFITIFKNRFGVTPFKYKKRT